MGEEHVGFVGDEVLSRHLLNPQYKITVGDVLLDSGSTFKILPVGKDPQIGGLHREFDFGVGSHNDFDVAGAQHGTTLPAALVLPSNGHFECFFRRLHLNVYKFAIVQIWLRAKMTIRGGMAE